MYDFSDVEATSKNQQVRAFAVVQTNDSFADSEVTDEEFVKRARMIEKFILNGVTDA